MSSKTPKYVNSPSFRAARNEFFGWVGLFAFLFILMVAGFLLTGGF